MVGFRKHSKLGNRCAKSVHNNQIISHADTGECSVSPKYSEVGMIIPISLSRISLDGVLCACNFMFQKSSFSFKKGSTYNLD